MSSRNLVFVSILINLLVSVYSEEEPVSKDIQVNGEKFEYIRKEPANELGIFSTVIASIHRQGNQTREEWRLNKAYLPTDVHDSLMNRCKKKDEKPFKWEGCVSDEEGLFVYVTPPYAPERKNKTTTYLELEFKPYTTYNEKGEKQVCVLEEVYKNKVFVVLQTYSVVPANTSFPKGVEESVEVTHQHQLDSFGENFLSIFEDKIDPALTYNFGKDEYYDRDPPYECFLSIASSESKSVIEEKCDFFCPKVMSVTKEEFEAVLKEAKETADEEEEEDVIEEDEDEEDDIVSLRINKREEL